MKNKKAKKFFAASNSSKGFVSYYAEIFAKNDIDKVYVIKGGPGTGKSYTMEQIASVAEDKGMNVERYYCSSDSNSLDGVILRDLKVAVIDGTSPHIYEPKTVGLDGEIVNLGDFWDSKYLKNHKEEIALLSLGKKDAYDRAYYYLDAMGKLQSAIDSIISPCILIDKMKNATKRIMSFEKGNVFCEHIGLINSFGMNGKISFDTYKNSALKLNCIRDFYGSSRLFLNEIYSLAIENKLDINVSRDFLLPEKIDTIFLNDSSSVFCVEEGEYNDKNFKSINMKRFIDAEKIKPHMKKLKETSKTIKVLEQLALDEFSKIKEYHFALEKIYSGAMDFDAKERYTDNFCRKIFCGHCNK